VGGWLTDKGRETDQLTIQLPSGMITVTSV
jgi:hypothetical protein